LGWVGLGYVGLDWIFGGFSEKEREKEKERKRKGALGLIETLQRTYLLLLFSETLVQNLVV